MRGPTLSLMAGQGRSSFSRLLPVCLAYRRPESRSGFFLSGKKMGRHSAAILAIRGFRPEVFRHEWQFLKQRVANLDGIIKPANVTTKSDGWGHSLPCPGFKHSLALPINRQG